MRYKKSNSEIKDKKITIKVTENERNNIHDIAKTLGYKSTSKYLLKVGENPVVFVGKPDQFDEMNTQISKIGTNINQIARKVNTNNRIDREYLEEIIKNQNQLRAYLKLIKEFHFFEKTTLKEMYKYGDY